jgi:hypothetical protein
MGFKFKAKVDSKEMKKSLNKYRDEFIKQTSNELQGLILNEIENGRSPVQGFGRFAKYSDSYLKQINRGLFDKKPRPVNLTLSGQLLNTLKITPKESDIEITFTDELFDVHNKQGAGKSKTVRRMLPTNKGEKFSRSITLRFAEIASLVAKKIFG